MKIYLVGGAVRDRIMGLPVREKDYVVVGATPEEMHAQGYKPIGKDFPVFLHPETKSEYALARTERKTEKGYTGFVFHASPDVTLEEDLKRRDLTINAMAMDEKENIIDFFSGKKDLEEKILRHVSDAFVEDPVRVLRIARFMARYGHLGFKIAKETKILLRKIVRSGEINALVAERVWQEWYKSLKEPSPDLFIKVLRECGALSILFPEIEKLFGIPSKPFYHPEIDTGVHVMMALQYAAKKKRDPRVCFSVLLHDLGKEKTPVFSWPSHKGHEKAGKPLIKILCQRYKVPKEYQELALLVSEYHLHVHRALELNPRTLLKLFESVDAFRRPERFELFLQACEADFCGRKKTTTEYIQKDFLMMAFEKVKKITISNEIDRAMKGAEIKEKLKKLRTIALTSFKKEQEKK